MDTSPEERDRKFRTTLEALFNVAIALPPEGRSGPTSNPKPSTLPPSPIDFDASSPHTKNPVNTPSTLLAADESTHTTYSPVSVRPR